MYHQILMYLLVHVHVDFVKMADVSLQVPMETSYY